MKSDQKASEKKRTFCFECHLKFKLAINFSKLMKNANQSTEKKSGNMQMQLRPQNAHKHECASL